MPTAGATLYPSASDAAWNGWAQFGINGGAPDDPWSINNTAQWMEYDPRNMKHKRHKIPIIEPCNTISNLAYYRILPDLCAKRANLTMDDDYVSAVIQGFATLGMGSSFMHASRTHLGQSFDRLPIAVIAYQYFQYINSALSAGASGNESILHELSVTPRAYDGRELATRIHTIPLNFQLNDWLAALTKLDAPNYYITFAAIIVDCLTLLVPDFLSDKLIPVLIGLFGLDDSVKAFILTEYVPTVRASMAAVQLTSAEKAALVPKFAGTLMKLFWAFTWQEATFHYPLLYNAEWNVIGALVTPSVNSLANRLTGFTHPDATIQEGESIYPGQEWCRVKHTAPHAKWHEISANGLMDLGYFADHIKAVIDAAGRRQEPRAQTDGSDLFVSSDVISDWALELQAQAWSEGYIVRQAFARVVKQISAEMDACSSGAVDGAITWSELVCYLTGIDSGASFVAKIFEGVSSHQKTALSQVHSTPDANPIFV
eukprot:NODE_4383_length_1898_cov_5.438171.p1 GENE.NODE_4383_length_1898_cov_5.438171~~NODE_4383_length_1898_cov_5.438171.p1  ORF type:complete len:486 (-),score=119.10 NODE_4383_length_1898_cov_5.438171:274-1731(-)